MISPRSYGHVSMPKDRSPSPKSKRSSMLSRSKFHRQDETLSEKDALKKETKSRKESLGKPTRIASISHSTPSAPVIIPTRTASAKSRRDINHLASRKRSVDQHDPSALSPSMAALLAVTSETRTSARAIKGDHRARLMRDSERKSVSSTSPRSWSILQSPPSPSDTENENDKETDTDFDIGSLTSQTTLTDRLMFRSLSSDSVPSLDIEGDVFMSPESPPMPKTPSSRRARSPRREKPKILSTSEPLAAGEMHPLSIQQTLDEYHSSEEEKDSALSPRMEIGASRVQDDHSSLRASSRFKSNLTASLQRLKTAAKSISIPAPSMSSVLAINNILVQDSRPLVEERPRSPLPITNPAFSEKTLSTFDRDRCSDQQLSAQLYFSSTPGEEYRPISSSVQLQEYTRQIPSDDPLLDRATAPPIFTSSTPPPPILLPGIDCPRPREPRENSDFLRVVVLEMSMRRAGKLGDVAGRARIWIGPRPEKAKSHKEPAKTNSKATESAGVTRAEKGMGEEVVSELAEALAEEVDQSAGNATIQEGYPGVLKKNGGRSRSTPPRWIPQMLD